MNRITATTRLALLALLALLLAHCADDDATDDEPSPAPSGPEATPEADACMLIAHGEQGEGIALASWPEDCVVAFDGEARGFPIDGDGYGDVAFANGVLSTYDGSDCSYCSPSGQPENREAGGEKCLQQYNCGVDGECAVRVYIDTTANRWTLDFAGPGCTLPPGRYDLFPTGKGECTGLCGPRECGTDGCGNSCGDCPNGESCEAGVCEAQSSRSDACELCLDACSGQPSCCTGCGCICESDCLGCF